MTVVQAAGKVPHWDPVLSGPAYQPFVHYSSVSGCRSDRSLFQDLIIKLDRGAQKAIKFILGEQTPGGAIKSTNLTICMITFDRFLLNWICPREYFCVEEMHSLKMLTSYHR